MVLFSNSFLPIFFQGTLWFIFGVGLSFGFPPFPNTTANSIPTQTDVFASKPAVNPLPSDGLPTENNFPFIVNVLNNQPWDNTPVFPTISSEFSLRCKPWPKIVNDFSNRFIQEVGGMEDSLKKFFEIHNANGDEIAEAFRSNIYKVHDYFGTPETMFSAQLIYHAGKNNYDRLTRDSYIQVIANFIGKYLYLRGVLSPDTVEIQSKQYFEELRKSFLLYSTAIQDLTSEDKIRAMIAGVINFLNPRGLYSQDSAWGLSALFANEWDNL